MNAQENWTKIAYIPKLNLLRVLKPLLTSNICDLKHSDKSVAELFAQKPDSDEELSYARSGEDMRCLRLGRDLVGWEYYAIPQFLPEIRIYKQFLPPSDPVSLPTY